MRDRVLIPITRREPPPGYRAPKYEDLDDTDGDMARAQAREDALSHEHEKAREAVAKALTTYRSWGWTNIINNIRLWLQARRIRRQQR